MRTHFRLLEVCTALALLSWPAEAGDALEQLKDACDQTGGNCSPNVPAASGPSRVNTPRAPTPRPVVKQPAGTKKPSVNDHLAVGLAQGLLQDLFSSVFSDSSEEAGPSPAERARLEKQRIAEFQVRAAAVAKQRAVNDAAQASNMESMAGAMSTGWDSPGGHAPVPLQGTRPSLFAPPVDPLTPRPPKPTAASERLARMAAEDRDVALLTRRLDELALKLEASQRESDLLRRSSERRVEEHRLMEETVARGVADARDRGMSMAFDGLFTANGKALEALSEVQASGRAWRELKSLLKDTQDGVEFLKDSSENLEAWSDDLKFATRQRDFKTDVTYLARRLGGPYAELGESILTSAQTVREQLGVLRRQGELQGFEKAYQARLDRILRDKRALIEQVKDVRGQLAKRTGLKPGDIALPAPPRHQGLGSEVPSLAE